jgi:hypothetical protein
MKHTRFLATLLTALVATAASATAQVKRPINTVPFVITKPGNYFLSKNLTVTKAGPNSNTDGIRIMASDVTIDLNGRTLSTAFPGQGSGIKANNQQSIRIFGGSISNFSSGVYVSGDGPVQVENLQVANCLSLGIWLSAENATVRKCVISNIGGGSVGNAVVQGIRVDHEYSRVEDCVIEGLTRSQANYEVTGIYAAGSAQIRGNIVSSLLGGQATTFGISVASYGQIEQNIISNFATGFYTNNTLSVYRNNSAYCTVKYTGGTDGGGNK